MKTCVLVVIVFWSLCYGLGNADVFFLQIKAFIAPDGANPVFSIDNSNPNFTSIVNTAKSIFLPAHLPTGSNYRGFQVILHSTSGVTRTVTITKCSNVTFEEELLQTVAQLQQTKQSMFLPGMLQLADNVIKACPKKISFMQVKLSVYSGREDPQFDIYKGNANFSSIAAATESRASTPLASILGYRGFTVHLFFQGPHGIEGKPVVVGKCADKVLENKLLQTVAKLHDSSGHQLQPSLVQYISTEIQGCQI